MNLKNVDYFVKIFLICIDFKKLKMCKCDLIFSGQITTEISFLSTFR